MRVSCMLGASGMGMVKIQKWWCRKPGWNCLYWWLQWLHREDGVRNGHRNQSPFSGLSASNEWLGSSLEALSNITIQSWSADRTERQRFRTGIHQPSDHGMHCHFQIQRFFPIYQYLVYNDNCRKVHPFLMVINIKDCPAILFEPLITNTIWIRSDSLPGKESFSWSVVAPMGNESAWMINYQPLKMVKNYCPCLNWIGFRASTLIHVVRSVEGPPAAGMVPLLCHVWRPGIVFQYGCQIGSPKIGWFTTINDYIIWDDLAVRLFCETPMPAIRKNRW